MNENRPSHWRKISAIAGGLGAAAGFAAFCRWQNSSLSVTTYRCGSHKLPSSFEDFVLLQVSDLHNKSFGRHQHGLLDRLAAEEPNAILITGDLVDCQDVYKRQLWKLCYNMEKALLHLLYGKNTLV